MNVHLELFKLGYQQNFDGLRRLTPRQTYIGVQYGPEIREKLKCAKGESGFATVLAAEKSLLPVAVSRLYPAQEVNSWYVALAVPRRKAVYGYENPRPNAGVEIANLMTNLRKSSFHGPDTDGALFYIRDSPGCFTQNPHCMSYWQIGSWAFVFTVGAGPKKYPKLADFIGDVFPEGICVPYPPPETKPKTVNEWDRPAGLTEGGLEERQRGRESLARLCPWAALPDVTRAWELTSGFELSFQQRLNRANAYLQAQYMRQPPPAYTTNWYQPTTTTYASVSAAGFEDNAGPIPGFRWVPNAAAPPPKAVPKEPEPLSKNGGRFVMLEDPE